MASKSHDCPICCETFNKSTRKPIKCGSCNEEYCSKCCETYLLSSADDPHCMGCKSIWSNMFCYTNFTKTFMHKKYKSHQKNILFDLEKSRIPSTMIYVEKHRENIEINNENKELQFEIDKLMAKIYSKRDKIYRNQRQIRNNDNFLRGRTGVPEEARKFIKKCPYDGCNGFLSKNWKCGACGNWVCPRCEDKLGPTKDENHVCDPDKVASIEFIKKDTKPCPRCGTNIHKITGCDQMWCVGCNVAFSWKTGRIINGTIHNPHYFEWLNNGGGENGAGGHVNTPGAIMCGGLPNIHSVSDWIERRFVLSSFGGSMSHGRRYIDIIKHSELSKIGRDGYKFFKTRLDELYRLSAHINDLIINVNRRALTENDDNRTDRMRYIMKEITEDNLKMLLAKKKKKKNFQREVLHVYELFNVVIVECLNDISRIEREGRLYIEVIRHSQNNRGYREYNVKKEDAQKFLDNFNEIIDTTIKHLNKLQSLSNYCNKELAKISVAYKLTVEIIPNLVNTPINVKFKTSDLKALDSLIEENKEKYIFDRKNIYKMPYKHKPWGYGTNEYTNTQFPKYNPSVYLTESEHNLR